MRRKWQHLAICAAIALSGVVLTLLLSRASWFQGISLKAQAQCKRRCYRKGVNPPGVAPSSGQKARLGAAKWTDWV